MSYLSSEIQKIKSVVWWTPEGPSFEMVSQSSHVWFAAFAVLALGLFHAAWWGFGAAVAFAAAKEFWWDVHYESVEVQGSAILDFGAMVIGAGLGLAAALWKL